MSEAQRGSHEASRSSKAEPSIPPAARLHIWQIQAVRDVLFIAALISLVWVGYAMRAVTVPLLVALMLAYLFEPLIHWITRRYQCSRPMAVGALLCTVGLLIVVLLALLVPAVIGQSVRLVEDIRQGRFERTLIQVRDMVPENYRDDLAPVFTWLGVGDGVSLMPPATEPEIDGVVQPTILDEERIRQLVREELAVRPESPRASATSLVDLFKRSGIAVTGLIGAIIQMGLLAFLIPFYFFFFSVSFPHVLTFVRDLIPVASRHRTLQLLGKMDQAIAGFVRGRIVITVLVGVMLAIGWIACGVPYAIVLGMVVGVFFLVPYLGGVGLPLAVGFLWFEQLGVPEARRMAWWAIILWPSVVFVLVQVIESYILTPLIAGKATNLGPVSILVAVLAGGSVGGVYGMLLAIPAAACLKILFTDVLLPRVKAWTHGKAADPLPM